MERMEKIKRIRELLANEAGEHLAYSTWSDDFCRSQLRELRDKIIEQLGRVSLMGLTAMEANELGFGRWSEGSTLRLAPIWLYPFLQPGDELESISGEKTVVGEDYTTSRRPAEQRAGDEVDLEAKKRDLTRFLFDQYGQGHYTREYAEDNAQAIIEVFRPYLCTTPPAASEVSDEELVEVIGDKIKQNADDYSKSMSAFRAKRFAQVALKALRERYDLVARRP